MEMAANPEHEAIEIARQGLVSLKARRVDGIVGEH